LKTENTHQTLYRFHRRPFIFTHFTKFTFAIGTFCRFIPSLYRIHILRFFSFDAHLTLPSLFNQDDEDALFLSSTLADFMKNRAKIHLSDFTEFFLQNHLSFVTTKKPRPTNWERDLSASHHVDLDKSTP
jgi:hypothetical protein